MFNLKNVAASAGVGFVLSFLISIISTHRFFVASFRGFVFAVVFALLAFAAGFLNKRLYQKAEGVPQAESLPKADSPSVDEPVETSAPAADSSAPEKTEPEIKPVAMAAEKSAQSQEIDALPDIAVFSGESDDDGDVINDSDFAQSDSSEKLPSAPTDGKASVEQDTKTIASAIRTLLKKDEM